MTAHRLPNGSMTSVITLNSSARLQRIDAIAAAWGGLVGGIGLILAGPRELAIRVAITVIIGVVAGFLTGVRAGRNRIMNAAIAWVLANCFYVAYVIAAQIVHLITGPAAPALLPGGATEWAQVTLISGLAILGGGAVAHLLLRPSRRRTHSL